MFCDGDFNGRKSVPKKAQASTTPDKAISVLRHEYSWIKISTNGAKINVPKPLPETAKKNLATFLYLSEFIVIANFE